MNEQQAFKIVQDVLDKQVKEITFLRNRVKELEQMYKSRDEKISNINNRLYREDGITVGDAQRQVPHCDALVLHRPGFCRFCDKHPERQQSRILRHVNFTGEHDMNKTSCPSEYFRPIESINKWGGNRAATSEVLKRRREIMSNYDEALEEWLS